jgi:Putative DNA-binding domain
MSGQSAFARSLRADAAPPGVAPRSRFHIYRNNVASAYANALAVRYPAAKRLVGDEFFAAMAGAFARDTPPVSPALILYGAAFPDFIASFPPAASLAYLADVARLESAWWQAYHAADVAPRTPERFAAIPEDELADARFVFHPSAQVMRSSHPIVSILEAQRGDGSLAGIDLGRAETALVYRRDLEVMAERIETPEADFLQSLMAGQSLGEAAKPGLDLEKALARLVASGIITGQRYK